MIKGLSIQKKMQNNLILHYNPLLRATDLIQMLSLTLILKKCCEGTIMIYLI